MTTKEVKSLVIRIKYASFTDAVEILKKLLPAEKKQKHKWLTNVPPDKKQ